jgi:Protein of unknown function (DUF742).
MHERVMSVFKQDLTRTRAEIAAHLNLPTASVAGRVNELIKKGRLRVFGTINCTVSGKKVQGLCRR